MDSSERATPIAHGLIAFISAMFAGLTPADWAAIFAASLNFLLICDWFWKRFWRPLLIRRGIIKIRATDKMREYMHPTAPGELDESKPDDR